MCRNGRRSQLWRSQESLTIRFGDLTFMLGAPEMGGWYTRPVNQDPHPERRSLRPRPTGSGGGPLEGKTFPLDRG